MRTARLKHLSGPGVAAVLRDFPLELAQGWDFDALATECEIALTATILDKAFDPERLPNVEIRDALAKLSKQARALQTSLRKIRPLDNRKLIDTALANSGNSNFIGFLLSDDNDFLRFTRFCDELDFTAHFLSISHDTVEQQAPKWRDSERRRLNVWRAERLIPVYETAFGREVTVNGFPSDARHREPTAFMLFYQRIIKLAFGKEIADLAAVLNEARRSITVETFAPANGRE